MSQDVATFEVEMRQEAYAMGNELIETGTKRVTQKDAEGPHVEIIDSETDALMQTIGQLSWLVVNTRLDLSKPESDHQSDLSKARVDLIARVNESAGRAKEHAKTG